MAESADLVRCPKCHANVWRDLPNTKEQVRTRFSCARCGYTILIGDCSKCRSRNWLLASGISEKGGHRPVYRLRCGTCGRTIGIIIDSFFTYASER